MGSSTVTTCTADHITALDETPGYQSSHSQSASEPLPLPSFSPAPRMQPFPQPLTDDPSVQVSTNNSKKCVCHARLGHSKQVFPAPNTMRGDSLELHSATTTMVSPLSAHTTTVNTIGPCDHHVATTAPPLALYYCEEGTRDEELHLGPTAPCFNAGIQCTPHSPLDPLTHHHTMTTEHSQSPTAHHCRCQPPPIPHYPHPCRSRPPPGPHSPTHAEAGPHQDPTPPPMPKPAPAALHITHHCLIYHCL